MSGIKDVIIYIITLFVNIQNGATNGNWTRDLILTMDALYHLSYRGMGLIILYAL